MEPTYTDLCVKYILDEVSKFVQYYKAPPQLLEGLKYIKNAEYKPFLAKLSETDANLMHNEP